MLKENHTYAKAFGIGVTGMQLSKAVEKKEYEK